MSIAAFGLVQQQFFPTSTRTELFVEMRLPEGSAIGVTDAAARKAERLLTGDPDIVTYTSYVGQGAPRFWLGLNPVLPNANFAQIVVVTKDLQARERVKARLEKALADGAISEARTRVDRFVFGPPVGYPVQFRVIGPDPLKVRDIAEQVRKVMAENRKLIDPHLDWGEQARAIRLEVDQDRARALGLTPQDVAQTLQTLLTRLHRDAISRRHRDHRRGRARGVRRAARSRAAAGPDDLDAQRRRGAAVADRAAQLRSTRSRSCGGATAISCSPCAATSSTACRRPTSATRWRRGCKPIKDALPYGYRIETGGAIEESEKANASLAVVFPVMAVVMLAILMIQLQSFSRLALVFVTAPLGIIGATGRAAHLQPPVRLRGAARHDRARRHDHAQHRHPGRPDRPRYRRRPRAPSRHHRRHRAARAAGGAHRARRDPRHDPARRQPVLGTDGDHHHGRPVRRHDPDAAGGAGALCAVVPGAGGRAGAGGPSAERAIWKTLSNRN